MKPGKWKLSPGRVVVMVLVLIAVVAGGRARANAAWPDRRTA